MAGGRPTDYNDDMLKKTLDYIEGFHAVVPSIERLSLHLKVSRPTIYDWAKEHKEFSYALDKLKAKQAAEVMDKGLTGEYNSTIAKLLLGNHGYSDKQHVDSTSSDGSMTPKITIIELRIIDNARD